MKNPSRNSLFEPRRRSIRSLLKAFHLRNKEIHFPGYKKNGTHQLSQNKYSPWSHSIQLKFPDKRDFGANCLNPSGEPVPSCSKMIFTIVLAKIEKKTHK